MKTSLNHFILAVILFYPIILGGIFFFNYEPFGITAPYFALLFGFVLVFIFSKKRVALKKIDILNLILLLCISILVIINFTTLRYSMPIFFVLFSLCFYTYLSVVSFKSPLLNEKVILYFLIFYLVLSFAFLSLDHSQMAVGNRYIGFTGSPTTFSGVLAAIFILWDLTQKKITLTRGVIFCLVLFFIVLSKTRLLMIFMVAYPLLIFMIRKKALSYSLVFSVFFSVLFFLYPLYYLVVQKFPQLVTLRYEDARDASFGLRYYLYQLVAEDFGSGTPMQMLFGKGNETSRLLVLDDFGKDLFPHNDFMRLINDWGAVTAILFFIFLFKISRKNLTTLMLSLVYIILFYSNMIFNLFLISILLLAYFNDRYYKTKLK